MAFRHVQFTDARHAAFTNVAGDQHIRISNATFNREHTTLVLDLDVNLTSARCFWQRQPH
jgi:hypothetical protein